MLIQLHYIDLYFDYLSDHLWRDGGGFGTMWYRARRKPMTDNIAYNIQQSSLLVIWETPQRDI